MKRDFKTVGGTVVMGVITAHVQAAPLPESIMQSGDSRMGCVWLPAMGACRLACLPELKSAMVHVAMPGYRGHGWGEDVLPIQL